MKVNSQGDSLWANYYNSPNCTWDDELQLNDLIITNDGSFMGVGYQFFYNTGRVMAWLFKTDANGTLGWNSSTPISEPILKVYPNPASTEITIQLTEKLKQEAEIIIYNSLGQIMTTMSLQKQQRKIKIDLRGIKEGAYFFKIISDVEIIGIGKFIKN